MPTSDRARELAKRFPGENGGDPDHVSRGHQRKDRKRWCRGKVGTEHRWVTGTRLNSYLSYHVMRKNGERLPEGPTCGWRENWRRPRVHGRREEYPYWRCDESRWCDNCGRVDRDGLRDECTIDLTNEHVRTFYEEWRRSHFGLVGEPDHPRWQELTSRRRLEWWELAEKRQRVTSSW